jgi:hypothetical protein
MTVAPWARGSVAPGSGFSISRTTINQLTEHMLDAKASSEKAHSAADVLVQGMAYITRSEAMQKSMGAVAARRRSNPILAYRIPVQRISGAYYAGWYVRRLGIGIWAVGNATKEAYLIETGMYQRVRRPILKMSVISMLQFLQTTRLADMFADSLIQPRRNSRGQFQSFQRRMMGTQVLGGMAGPSGSLPG